MAAPCSLRQNFPRCRILIRTQARAGLMTACLKGNTRKGGIVPIPPDAGLPQCFSFECSMSLRNRLYMQQGAPRNWQSPFLLGTTEH